MKALLAFLCACAVCAFAASLSSPAAPRDARLAALPDFVSLARRFDPSLVHISTVYSAVAGDAGADAPNAARSATRGGLGSGVIVHRDGHILTNDHVITNAENIFVKLGDRRVLPARVVGRDARSDLALIKVAAPAPLAAAPLGDSGALQTGEWVVALGSPFGLDRTLTAGIVSAKARRLATSVYCDYIQTDVTINPGNSGGPLLNLRGLVVGINTAILSRDGNNTGVNFAIPINLIKDLLPELFSRGRVSRGWVGISTLSVSAATARLLRLDNHSGALVVHVAPGGPAARVGIRPGDIVVTYDGRAVAEAADLPALVARTAAGRSVELYVNRNRILYRALLAVEELRESEPESSPSAAVSTNSALLTSKGVEFRS
jgi:serine protease Do